MHLKPMDPDKIRKLLKQSGVPDLTIRNAREDFIKDSSCPDCGHHGTVYPIRRVALDPEEGPGERVWGKCPRCDCEFEPSSGVIVQQGGIPQEVLEAGKLFID